VVEDTGTQARIDEQAALAALDGNRDLLCELAKMFCEDSPLLLAELQVAVARGDAMSARRIAHSLRGLAATFYAQPTVEIAHYLELAAAEGRWQVLTDGGVEQLAQSIISLIDQLKTCGFTN
jgi:HPt (histidine-containing phosphotransfer) domain-containing protein